MSDKFSAWELKKHIVLYDVNAICRTSNFMIGMNKIKILRKPILHFFRLSTAIRLEPQKRFFANSNHTVTKRKI